MEEQRAAQKVALSPQPPPPSQKPQVKKVHFSQVEAERQQLSSSNYNKSASGFTASSFAEVPKPSLPPQPTLPTLPTLPSNVSSHKVATPKFRAMAPRQQSWTPGTSTLAANDVSRNLSDDLNQKQAAAQSNGNARQPAAVARWTPSQTAPVAPLNIDDYSSNSLVMDNLNATYTLESNYSPPTLKRRNQSLPNIQTSPGPDRMCHLQQKAKQKTPPPTPPGKPTAAHMWFPGMKPDPNQFNVQKKFKTAPPAPPKKTSFATTDLLAGPSAMCQKFEVGNIPQQFTPVRYAFR